MGPIGPQNVISPGSIGMKGCVLSDNANEATVVVDQGQEEEAKGDKEVVLDLK